MERMQRIVKASVLYRALFRPVPVVWTAVAGEWDHPVVSSTRLSAWSGRSRRAASSPAFGGGSTGD